MTEVKSGDTVRIHYTGTFADGSSFDSSTGRDPLEFTVGGGQIVPGLDKAIPGMTVGEQKKVTVSPAEGYGESDPQAIQSVARSDIPAEIELSVDAVLQVQNQEGRTMHVRVAEITDDTVALDANHPLAGKELIFDIELVEIV